MQQPPAKPPEKKIELSVRPATESRWAGLRRHALFLAILGAAVGCAFGIVLGLSRDLPQIVNLENFKPILSSLVYSADGRVVAEFGIEKRRRTALARIPIELQEAMIAVEDQRFRSHFGINPFGIARAAWANLRAGGVVQGGSTITQQLARNLFLTRKRNLSRKLREAILALQIERSYTKEQILELYLNQIYLGHGAYGVEEAAEFYFGRHVEDLSLAQCAMLAALPKAPNRYSPKNNPSLALRRRNLVIEMMYDEGYITKEQCVEAKFEPLLPEGATTPTGTFAPYFSEYVRQQVIDRYGYNMLYKGGLQIYTTLDYDIQQAAEKAVSDAIEKFDAQQLSAAARRHTTDPAMPDELRNEAAGVVPEDMATDVVQAALVAIDPATGEIRAMIGGRDFAKSEFNRATQARRQPGSGFKPFIWAAAFEKGMTPSDRIVDAPVAFHYRGEVWEPKNYEDRFYGLTTLREALEHSRNIVAIRLLNEIGITPVINLAHRMGIESYLTPNLTLALGSTGVSPIEITSAYATIASGGIYREPVSIVKIVGPDGETIEEKHPSERIALSEQTAYIMTTLMQGVIERGTGRAAQALGRPAAGKTGTTNDCTDAWFLGFTPQLVASVWIGFDDMRSIGEKQTGGRVAAPIWTEFMKAALANKPVETFAVPSGIEIVEVEPDSGLLAPPGSERKLRVAFREGSTPTKYYDPSEEDRLTREMMRSYSLDLSL